MDFIKGVACLLMVVAHVHFAEAPWLQSVTMAAVLFFATTGMNLTTIVERRPEQEMRLAANAVFLIFAGFADNYVQGTLWMCDVFQSAGMAMLAMLLLRRVAPRSWTWLFPIPFLLHFANQQLHWKIAEGGISSFFLAPGLFPLLPWLSFYLLGAHLKRVGEARHAWLLGGLALLTLAVLNLFRPFHFDKFWMSPDYFLIGCAVAALSFAMLRQWFRGVVAEHCGELRRWGANSLVFYIMNAFVIRVLEMAMPHGMGLFLLSLLVTAILLRPALALQAAMAGHRPERVLIAGGAAAGVVLAANSVLWPEAFYLHTIASFGLTFAYVACYPAWKNLSRAQMARRAASASPKEPLVALG